MPPDLCAIFLVLLYLGQSFLLLWTQVVNITNDVKLLTWMQNYIEYVYNFVRLVPLASASLRINIASRISSLSWGFLLGFGGLAGLGVLVLGCSCSRFLFRDNIFHLLSFFPSSSFIGSDGAEIGMGLSDFDRASGWFNCSSDAVGFSIDDAMGVLVTLVSGMTASS